jgi:hypothetical protein
MSNNPIFVVGAGRSGTTLLSLMLDTHSRIAIPHESHFFIPYYEKRAAFGNLNCLEGRRVLIKSILGESFIRIWDQQITLEEIDLDRCGSLEGAIDQIYSAYARRFGKDIWGDKTPAYTTEVDALNDMFPTSRFIHIVRDGRDVALSVMRQTWGSKNFIVAMQYWTQTVTLARKMLRMLPKTRFIELRYEDLIANPERELHTLTDFLGLPYEPDMVNGYTKTASKKLGDGINQFQHTHLLESPSTTQVYKWKTTLNTVNQAIAFEIAGPMLTEMGYSVDVRRHPLRVFYKTYYEMKEILVGRLQRLTSAISNADQVRQGNDD